MVKFLLLDLPLFLDMGRFQTLIDIELLKLLLAIFPLVIIIGFTITLYPFAGNAVRLAVLFHKTGLFHEAALRRHLSPLWFALGP